MKTLREEKLIRHNKILTIILIILVVLVSIIIGIIIGEYFATMSLKK